MITDINLRNLRNAEYLQFMTDVLQVVHQYPENALESDEQIGTLRILEAELQILVNNDPVAPFSNDIAGIDAARDRLLTGLIKLCDAHTYGPDPDKRAAADLLCESLAHFGANRVQEGYQTETATITNILSAWSTRPELIGAVSLIDAEEWTHALHASNESFKAVYHHGEATLDTTASSESIRDKRAETNDAWYQLRDRLDSLFARHEGAAPWSTAVAHINALIDQCSLRERREGNPTIDSTVGSI